MDILTHRAIYKWLGVTLFASGVVILAVYTHWSAGLAVWLMMWGNNWEQKFK